MLELCWKPRPNERPSLKAVFRCLGGDTGTSTLAGAEADTGADDQSDFATASGSGTFSVSASGFRLTLNYLVSRQICPLPVVQRSLSLVRPLHSVPMTSHFDILAVYQVLFNNHRVTHHRMVISPQIHRKPVTQTSEGVSTN